MQISTPLGDALVKYLDLTSDQMKLTAGNMANIDTPGYKTQGFDFASEFGRAMGSPMPGIGAGVSGATTSPRIGEVDGLVARPDGNTVSLDREAMQLAKAQLQFRTGVALLKTEYNRVLSAIHMDGK